MQRRSFFALLAGFLMFGASLAASAQTPQLAPVPDGQVAVRYFRADGDYTGWGVHFWESFEKVKDGKVVGPKDKSDMPIGDIAWTKPMMPSGKDGFGAYWFVKVSEFRNGKINYIIHKGDTKEQCGKDIAWFVETQGKEVFVNNGDCNTYLKVDDAIAARKK
ncbi:MAG TPA: pullulanase-associated domain-containing protein [Burkholderiaceae bacterium]|nr:pullulanase-associated domain-containing protein [Burkholderiaceae bacterium]